MVPRYTKRRCDPAIGIGGNRMKIDWNRKADESVGESASVLRRARRSAGGGLERTLGGTGQSESERLDRLGEALATSQAAPDGGQAALKEQVLDGARSGLAKVNQ